MYYMKKTVGFAFVAGIILMFLLVIIGVAAGMIEKYSKGTNQWDASLYYLFDMEENTSADIEDSFKNAISKKFLV